jgi:hypothetical protein
MRDFETEKSKLIQDIEIEIGIAQSDAILKKIKGIDITYFGRAWTKQLADWIYFDTVLDIEKLRNKYNTNSHVSKHKKRESSILVEMDFN